MHVVQPAGFAGEVRLLAPITREYIADAVVDDSLASRAEVDAVVRELFALAADGRTVMSLPRVVQAWGARADVARD